MLSALAIAAATIAMVFPFAYRIGHGVGHRKATQQARRVEAMRLLGTNTEWEFRESGNIATLETYIYARAPDGTEYTTRAFDRAPRGWHRVHDAALLSSEEDAALTRRLSSHRTKRKVGLL
jgi:hypothetical protein